MRLDRSLIKSQAKAIIKGQVFGLFLISIVVGLLTGGIGAGISFNSNTSDSIESYIEDFFENRVGEKHHFDDFTDGDGNKPDTHYFDDFDFDGKASLVGFNMPTVDNRTINRISTIYSNFGSIISIAMAPLTITLCGLYVMLIRGNKMKTSDYFSFVFTKTFNPDYLKKLLLYILKSLIIFGGFCLLIIPGIIFYYRYYFAEMILMDNPNMDARDALKLSKEMTKGHKGELFALELSFIGWALLFPLTLGLISIYVLPYYSTTKALYYENFRIRCIQESMQPQMKFMTADEANNFYASQQPQPPVQEPVVEEPKPTYGSGMDTNYYNSNF